MMLLNVVLVLMVALAGALDIGAFDSATSVAQCKSALRIFKLLKPKVDCDVVRAFVKCYLRTKRLYVSEPKPGVFRRVETIFRQEFPHLWSRCGLNISEIMEDLRRSCESHTEQPGKKSDYWCKDCSTLQPATTTSITTQPTTTAGPDCVPHDDEACWFKHNGNYSSCDKTLCAIGFYVICIHGSYYAGSCEMFNYTIPTGGMFNHTTPLSEVFNHTTPSGEMFTGVKEYYGVFDPITGTCERKSDSCPRDLDRYD